MNDPLTELATVPPIPLHGALPGARASVRRIAASLLAVPDEKLDSDWRWRVTDTDDVELRDGFYAIHEHLERATGAIAVGRAGTVDDDDGLAGDVPLGPAVPALGAMTAARWDLHGVLTPLPDEVLDADPGGGEWTVRQTLGHILGSQLSYGWFNAWFLSRPVPVGEAVYPDEGDLPPEPTEEELATGTLAEIRDRFDGIADSCATAVADLSPATLDLGARWSGLPVSIGFRLGRYGSHIREHTVQVDKTLALLHREPRETERLVRLVLATYGRLEAQVIGRPAADLDRSLGGGPSAIVLLTEAVAEAEATAASVRRAATV
jgi:DinB family protein